MIKFFRKIRQQLLTENRFSKYLLYAIGEIVLVVIGILIALQINNWNEKRKQEDKFTIIFKQIHKDLAFSIQESDDLIEKIRVRDSLIYLVLTNQITAEDYKQFPDLKFLAFYDEQFTIQNTGYSNLIQNIDNLPDKFSSLLEGLGNVYINDKELVLKKNQSVYQFSEETVFNFFQDKDWYTDYSYFYILDDDIINFFLTDSSYRNILSSLQALVVENQLRFIFNFRTDAIRSFKSITKMLELEDQVKADSLPFIENINYYRNYIGTYEDDKGKVEVTIENDKIYIHWSEDRTDEVYPLSVTKFYIDKLRWFCSFKFNEKGEVNNLEIHIGNDRYRYKFLNNSLN